MKKVHDSFDIITELLLGYGMSVLPKGDGRLEIPQHVVKMLGWSRKKELFFSLRAGFLVVSSRPQADTHIGKVAVNMGRARVPLNILKAAGMNGDALMLVITDGEEIVLRPFVVARDFLKSLVAQLDSNIVASIAKILTVDRSVVYDGQAPLIVEQSHASKFTTSGDRKKTDELSPALPDIGEKSGEKDGPFLILPNISECVVFRPVGLPFRFPGHWFHESCELVRMAFFSTDATNFYLIPGIRRVKGGRVGDKYRFGFLLLNTALYGRVSLIVRAAQGKSRDLILMYQPLMSDSFAVYTNPPEDIPEDVVKAAMDLCSDPEGFMKKTFREYDRNKDGGFFSTVSPALHAKRLEKFLCNPKIG
jgi:hypothetical protein